MKDNQKNHLKELYQKLTHTTLPCFSENNQLANWIEDLILTDGYLAGLALSASEGEQILQKELPDLEKLERALSDINTTNKKDAEIQSQCQNYLGLLKDIRQAMKTNDNFNKK